ncbi:MULTISPECIES: helix-turn-helix domain-containing protein [Chryseobacterium]|uniref:helix-turn-helix domain-containing protein n=1 Tax=Chryseobacterium TaxID=59732 RepID=UPI00192212B0|nr:helix-turn-helix domain-containing protein [Chryseobacterium sp. KMC2]MBL3547899.1 AraC family transcriptional regulator [Chryseobacterium sp. KMC2]
MNNKFIEKDFEFEAQIKDHIAYFPLAGESEISGFRAPDSYVFIFFEKAFGSHFIDFVEYEEKDNQVHISFPGQLHSWKTEKGAKGHKLILSKEFIEMKLYNSRFSSLLLNKFPVLDIPVKISKKLSREFKMIQEEFGEEPVNWDVISSRVKIIFSLINKCIDEAEQDALVMNRRSPIILNFIELIEVNFTESKAVAYYADKLAVTPNYLNILTKSTLGVTAKELIDARIVLEAKRLLKGSDQTVKEIAFNLGFYSIASFSSYLQGKTGLYPTKFRE